MGLPSALLLDLDDTVLDALGNPDEVWRRLCREFADRLGAVTPGQLHAAIVESREWFWADTGRARRARLDLREARRQVVRGAFERLCLPALPSAVEMADRFTVVREEAVKPLPGAIETLRQLRETDIRLGLLTNGQTGNQRRKIERLSLNGFFDQIQIEEEFGVGKPDERAFRPALEALGVGLTEAWMVDDNLEHDIGGAQRVGVHGVWVDARGDGLLDGMAIRPGRTIGALPPSESTDRLWSTQSWGQRLARTNCWAGWEPVEHIGTACQTRNETAARGAVSQFYWPIGLSAHPLRRLLPNRREDRDALPRPPSPASSRRRSCPECDRRHCEP